MTEATGFSEPRTDLPLPGMPPPVPQPAGPAGPAGPAESVPLHDRVLALAQRWDQESEDMRAESVRTGLHPALASGHREANRIRYMAAELRTAIGDDEPAAEPVSGLPEGTSAAGAKVRAAREAADMTQLALATKLGVTQTAVSYWEAGKRDMGVADLMRVAAALAVAPSALLPGWAADAHPAPGKLARVEVKGFRDLGVVRVSETTLAGEPMLHAECADGSSADFPPSSLHFITWLPEGTTEADLRKALPVGGSYDDGDPWSDRGPF